MLINGTPINLDFDTVLVWLLVGLVAGFLASHVALGHGMGLLGDIVVGILGALLGGLLSAVFHFSIVIVGHPTVTAMIMAFIGAFVLLLLARLLGMGSRRRVLT